MADQFHGILDIPDFPDINRAAVVIKPKKPFIDWIINTGKKYDPQNEVKREEIQTEGFDSKSIYLIPAYEDIKKYENYIRRNFKQIFEHELNGWYTDPEMWPGKRTWKEFKEWFDWEIQTLLFDMASDKPLEHEGGF
jgi:hypothetical protein